MNKMEAKEDREEWLETFQIVIDLGSYFLHTKDLQTLEALHKRVTHSTKMLGLPLRADLLKTPE